MNPKSLMRAFVMKRPRVKRVVLAGYHVLQSLTSVRSLLGWIKLLSDRREFVRMGGQARFFDFWPCLLDRTISTGIDSHYFHQAVWAGRHIRDFSPTEHVDVGSDVRYVGMLTILQPVRFVDIRPLELNIPNYAGIDGSILDLPFADNSIDSISCMHVIEHIGLGRYGDPLDPMGSEKACRELQRVLAKGGQLLVSTPVGSTRVQFNGQRVFSVKGVLKMFEGLELMDMGLVDAAGTYRASVSPGCQSIADLEMNIADSGLGLFKFSKR